MTLSWLAFLILVAGAGGFAAWIYVRRELPIPRRRLLGTRWQVISEGRVITGIYGWPAIG